MPLYPITGLSGTGKSAVNIELRARGFESYDGDEDGFAQWFNSETGLPVDVAIEDCTPEFLANHTRDISRDIVEKLWEDAKDKDIFLCGAHENEGELQEFFPFPVVFGLVLDEDIREKRLLSRTNNDWGKLPHERQYSLAFKDRWLANCRRFNYVTIDANQPTPRIVDLILEEVRAREPS